MALYKNKFDPSAIAVSNQVVNEVHTLATINGLVIVANSGLFYTKSLVITKVSTNLDLVRNVDYSIQGFDAEITAMTGYEVAAAIAFTDPSISGDVSISYQAVGGMEGENSALLIEIRERLEEIGRQRAVWHSVINKPATYPPEDHMHNILTDLTGLDSLRNAIEALTTVLTSNRVPELSGTKMDDKVNRLLAVITSFRNDLNTLSLQLATFIINSNLTVLSNDSISSNTIQGYIDHSVNSAVSVVTTNLNQEIALINSGNTTVVILQAGEVNATANATVLQTAANNSGKLIISIPGIYYVASTIVLPSNTLVELCAGVELKQVHGAAFFPFFSNARFTPTLLNITSITYTMLSGTGPNMARGTVLLSSACTYLPNQPVIIDGDISFSSNGGHRVETVSGNTFTFLVGSLNSSYLPTNANNSNVITSAVSKTFTGNISGNQLTVTSITGNTLVPGQFLLNNGTISGWPTNTTNNVRVEYQVSGTAGGLGVYTLNKTFTTISPVSFTALPSQLVVSLADENIGVVGSGRLNCNYLEGGGIANLTYLDNAITFNNVIRPFVGGGDTQFLTVNDGIRASVAMSRVVDPKIVGINSDATRGAAIRLYGPVFGYPEVKKVTGSYGGNGVVFCNTEIYSNAAYLLPGAGGNFYEGGLIKDVRITNADAHGLAVIYPAQSLGSTYIGTTTYQMYGKYTIDNIGHKYEILGGVNDASVSIGGNCYDTGYIDEVVINNVIGSINFTNGIPNYIISINKVSIKNWSNHSWGDYSGLSFDTTTINKFDIDANIRNSAGSTVCNAFTLNSGLIDYMTVSGVFSSDVSAGTNIIHSVGATVNTLKIKDAKLIGYTKVFNSSLLFVNTPRVIIDELDASTSSLTSIAVSSIQPFDITVRDTTSSPTYLFDISGSGAIRLEWSGIRLLNTASIINSAGINVTITNPQQYTTPTVIAPVPGNTVYLYNKAGFQRLIIAPTSALSSLTLALPTNPLEGEIIELSILKDIQVLTLTNGTMTDIVSGVTTIAGGFAGKYVYNLALTTWVKIS